MLIRPTVEGNTQEQFVGDVHHDGSQQVEGVHMSGGVSHLLQVVKVFVGGTDAHPNCPLKARARQSFEKREESRQLISIQH